MLLVGSVIEMSTTIYGCRQDRGEIKSKISGIRTILLNRQYGKAGKLDRAALVRETLHEGVAENLNDSFSIGTRK